MPLDDLRDTPVPPPCSDPTEPVTVATELITIGADDAPVCTDGVCLP